MERLQLLLNNFADLQKELTLLSKQLETEKSDMFNAIVENTTSFIAIFQNEKFVFLNSRALVLLQCRNSTDIIGHSIFEILHPKYHSAIRERQARIRKNLTNEAMQVKFKTTSGTYIDIEASSLPFTYNQTAAVLIVGRNISAEVELKNKLLEEDRLRHILMEMHPDLADFYTPDAILKFNTDGQLLYISPSHEEILEVSGKSVIGLSPSEMFQNEPEAGQTLLDAISTVIETQSSLKVDLKFTTQTGKPRYDLVWLAPQFSEKGKVEFILAITRKITSLKEAEKKLKQSIDRLYQAELIASIGHIEYDIADNIRTWSEGALTILGVPPNERVKRIDGNYYDRIHPEDADRVEYEQRRSILKNVPFDQMYRITDFNGQVKMIHGIGKTQYNKEGNPIKFMGIVQDVTQLFDLNKRISEEMDKYKLFIDDAPIGVMLFKENHLQYANKQMLQLVGISNQHELSLIDRMEAIVPEDRKLILTVIDQIQNKPLSAPINIKLRIHLQGSNLKHIRIILSSCFIGEQKYVQVIVTDITSEVEKESKVRQLAADALYLGQKNKLIDVIEHEIAKVIESKSTYTKSDLQNILGIIKGFSKSEQEWDLFKTQINELHPNFFSRLKNDFPCLTQHDIKHCAYIKLNFDTKEIARFFNVKPETIQTSRVRMKKKMKLTEDIDLKDFILKY